MRAASSCGMRQEVPRRSCFDRSIPLKLVGWARLSALYFRVSRRLPRESWLDIMPEKTEVKIVGEAEKIKK